MMKKNNQDLLNDECSLREKDMIIFFFFFRIPLIDVFIYFYSTYDYMKVMSVVVGRKLTALARRQKAVRGLASTHVNIDALYISKGKKKIYI